MFEEFIEELRYLEQLLKDGDKNAQHRLPAWEASYKRVLTELFEECRLLTAKQKVVPLYVYTLQEEALRILKEIYKH